MTSRAGWIVSGALSVSGALGCRPEAGDADPVDVIYAASLTASMERLESRFSARHGRAVRGDPRGSVAGAHLIREGVWRPDAYITADPATLPLLGSRDPGWGVVFARSEVVIAYVKESRFAAALDSARRGDVAWQDVALRGGFRLGRTDPDLDPKGYRAIFAFELAERHYGRSGLADSLLAGPAGPASVFPEEHLSVRVQTGSLDAGVFYLAEAKAHGLQVIRLPGPLSQSDPGAAGALAGLEHRTGEGVVFQASPVLYVATIPLDSPDPAAAADFIAFLLGDGRPILTEEGYVPASGWVGNRANAPKSLAALLDP